MEVFGHIEITHLETIAGLITQITCRSSSWPSELRKWLSEIALKEDNDRHRLYTIQDDLSMAHFSVERQQQGLKAYSLELSYMLQGEILEQATLKGLGGFQHSEPYQAWISSLASKMLVLSGYNERSFAVAQNSCWLSPIAVDVIEDISTNGEIIAYQLHSVTTEPLVPYVLYQLLRSVPKVLRNDSQFDELRVEITEFKDACEEKDLHVWGSNSVLKLKRLCLRVLNLLADSKIVYIILDRVDCCEDFTRLRSTAPQSQTHDQRKVLLRLFAFLIAEAKCLLKVLLVVHAWNWPVDTMVEGLELNRDQVIFHTMNQNIVQGL